MSSWFACVALLLAVMAPACADNITADQQKRSTDISDNPGAPLILQKQSRMSRRLAKERYQRSKLGPGDKTWERELLEMRLAITEKLDNLEWTLRHLDERLGRLEEETDRVSSSCDGGSVGLQLNLERIENSVATLALRLEDKLKAANAIQKQQGYPVNRLTDQMSFKENDPKESNLGKKPENLHRSGHRNSHRRRMKSANPSDGETQPEFFKQSRPVERNMRETNEKLQVPDIVAKEEVSYPDGDSIPSRDHKQEPQPQLQPEAPKAEAQCAENDEACLTKKEKVDEEPPKESAPHNIKRCQTLAGRGNKVADLTETDCYDLKHLHGCPSGVYTVAPPKVDGPATFYCDMETKGGGWTVIQRRGRFGSRLENFNRTWNEYRKGFGSRKGEFWIGNDILHSLTYHRPQTLRIELYHRPTGRLWYAHYSHFKVGPEEEGFRLLVSGFEGDAKDGLSFETGQPFVTLDHAPSDSLKICSTKEGSGWWYSEAKFLNVTQCNHHLMGSNLNAPFKEFTELSESTHNIGKGGSKETRVFKYAAAIYWRGKYIRASHFDFVAMKMRPEVFDSEEKEAEVAVEE